MISNAVGVLSAATELREAARPVRAVTLDTLTAIPAARLAEIMATRHLVEDDIRSVVERTDLLELSVIAVLRKFSQLDCAGYRSQYQELLDQCEALTGSRAPGPPSGWHGGGA